jgi:hypothetical protein
MVAYDLFADVSGFAGFPAYSFIIVKYQGHGDTRIIVPTLAQELKKRIE